MTVVVLRSRLSGPWTISVHVIWPNLRFWLTKIPFCRVDDLDKHDMQHWNQISRVLHLLSVSLSKNYLDFALTWKTFRLFPSRMKRPDSFGWFDFVKKYREPPLLFIAWKLISLEIREQVFEQKPDIRQNTLHYISHHLGVCEAFRV